ncbi:MAG TPA: carbon starvation CstA 5TM domain-containing protein, partial [Vicinamibacteria bacterium]|nr:carbon starvation CstA 5TM domain-containing protein [Vicinamibacteria bacterium]
VGYGGMLLEAFVALIALSTVMIATGPDLATKGPSLVYAEGLGRYLAAFLGPEHLVFATTFGAMAFSTFVFDTLDVSTRLGRYILQELFARSGRASAVGATLLTVLIPLAWLLAAGEGAFRLFWTLFGTSNQLLAALSLLGISVWLRRLRRPTAFTVLPMAFVMAMTLWALVLQVVTVARVMATSGLRFDSSTLNALVCVMLIGLAVVLVVEAARVARRPLEVRAS